MVKLTQNSFVSIGLLITLVCVSFYAGNLYTNVNYHEKKIDQIELEIKNIRNEISQIKDSVRIISNIFREN